MYSNYGLQISVRIQNCEGNIHLRSPVVFDKATLADVEGLVQQTKLRTCRARGCSKLAFDMPEPATNRNGYCEACFLAKLTARYEKVIHREARKNLKRFEDAYAAGYRHLATLWIHPEQGDDYHVEMLSVRAQDSFQMP